MIKLSERSKFAGNAIEELDAIAEKLEYSGKKIAKLNRGDPAAYFPTPKFIIDAYVNALRESKSGYSFHAGIKPLRDAICNRQKRLYGLDCNEDEVIVTQGVSEAISIINSMLINPGDFAAMFSPYYTLYMSSLLVSGGMPITIRCNSDDNYRMDPDRLRKRLKVVKKKPKYLIFSNPCNPTGHVVERKDLRDIADISNDNNMLIVSDEIYDEIVYNGAKFTSISEVAKGMPMIILGGASKNFDSTGFRIGYAIIPDIGKESRMLRDKFADFAKMRLSSNTPAQYAFLEALSNEKEHSKSVKKMVGEIEDRVNFSYDLLSKSRFLKAGRPKGAFYVLAEVDMKKLKFKDDFELVRRLLVEENVQVTRGSGFGAENHIRIVSLPPKEILEYAIRKIDKFLQRNSK